jgi:hypothetical protein
VRSKFNVPSLGLVALTLLIASCGGGGGSGSGGGGGGGGGGSSGTLSLSTSSLDFVTNDPAVTPAQQLVTATITTTATGTLYLKVVVTGQVTASVTNITVTPPNSGSAVVSVPTASTLGPGRFTGTIQVTACTSGPDCASGVIGTTQTINLTYTINGVAVATSALNYTISDSSVPADYTQQLSITAYPAYTASTDAGWVGVAPASGASGAAQLTVNLDQNLVNNGESGPQLAHINIVGQGGNTVSVPVNLVVAKPQIDQVTPYIGYTGVGATVTVRGQYLDLLPNTPPHIDLAPTIAGTGTDATSVVRVSPTELTVTYPAMPSGKYLVRMHDAQDAVRDRSHAYLAVIDKPVYTATTLQYPAGAPPALLAMAYDAERQALLVGAYHSGASADTNELIRYTYTNAWSAPATLPIPYLSTFALSANGADLLVASATTPPGSPGVQAHLDTYSPDATSVRQSLDTGALGDDYSYIAFTSQNRALLMQSCLGCSGTFSVFDYSVKSNLVAPRPDAKNMVQRGSLSASGDGQRIVAGDLFTASVGDYDASTDSFAWQQSSIGSVVFAPQLDRTGALLVNASVDVSNVIHFRAFDRNWNLLGEVQAPTPNGTQAFALAPDGTRLYTYTMDNKLHTYDLVTAPVAGQYAEIGTGTALAGDPGVITGGFSYPLMMTITPDGGTVFIGSAGQIVVQPVN